MINIYAWIEPTKIENPCHTIKPGIPIIQPQALLTTKPANNESNNSPAKILPYKRSPSVSVEENSSKTLIIAKARMV